MCSVVEGNEKVDRRPQHGEMGLVVRVDEARQVVQLEGEEREGKVFVLPNYNQSMEQQREMTLKRTKYLQERGFKGWLMAGEGKYKDNLKRKSNNTLVSQRSNIIRLN
ncbi:hypothetical protein GOBAR_DD21296 [Gossypium barbadense]|nr:hypothetical protein GOBAR_DD21296 [Gossypium barbadense]